MERKKDKNEGKIHFRKEGGGTMRLTTGKIIKPTQDFWAFEHQVPKGGLDLLTRLEDSPPPTPPPEEQPVEVAKSDFHLEHRGGGWYNILNADGKKLNEKALTKDEADEHLAKLEA